MQGNHRLLGLLLVLAATVLWSTAGLFVRLVDLDTWRILGWRSLFAALALAVIVMLENRKPPAPGSAPTPILSLLITAIAAVSMCAYVIALKLTTVANVMVVYATVPLVAAAVAWLLLREHAPRSAIVASIIAFVGVIVMVRGAVNGTDFWGIAMASLMTLAMGTQIVMARKYPALQMSRINMFAAALSAGLGLLLATPGIPPMRDLLVLALFGITNTALAYYFVLVGARYIPSAETGLISSLDVVLGPLWVWLLMAENPGRAAIIGGAIVLVAVLGYILLNYRLGQRPEQME